MNFNVELHTRSGIVFRILSITIIVIMLVVVIAVIISGITIINIDL